nr:uncharacterized protein LOC115253619 [Aedes albopictus]
MCDEDDGILSTSFAIMYSSGLSSDPGSKGQSINRKTGSTDRQLIQETLQRQWKLDQRTRLADGYILEMCTGLCVSKACVRGRQSEIQTIRVSCRWMNRVIKDNGAAFYYDRGKSGRARFKDLQMNLSSRAVVYGEIFAKVEKQKIVHALT